MKIVPSTTKRPRTADRHIIVASECGEGLATSCVRATVTATSLLGIKLRHVILELERFDGDVVNRICGERVNQRPERPLDLQHPLLRTCRSQRRAGHRQ